MFDVIKYDGYFDFGWIQFSFVIRGTATNCKSFEMDPPTKQMIRYVFVNSIVSCEISKMVVSKKQDSWPKFNIPKGNYYTTS